jgi:hypothetical protein
MTRILLVLGMALALGASATSYRDSYATTPLGNGRYLIEARGNGFTDRSTVIRYAYQRAAELCPIGFDVVDADQSTTSNDVTFDGGKTYQTVNKSQSTVLVQCKRREPRGWWCTSNGDVGGCVRVVGECEAMRGAWNEAKPAEQQMDGCAQQPQAICAPSGCRATPASCSRYERVAGRDGSACAVQP